MPGTVCTCQKLNKPLLKKWLNGSLAHWRYSINYVFDTWRESPTQCPRCWGKGGMIFIVKRLYDRLIQSEAEQCNEHNKALGLDAWVQIPMRPHNGRPWPSHLGSAKWGSASLLGKKKKIYLSCMVLSWIRKRKCRSLSTRPGIWKERNRKMVKIPSKY